jgi:ABC-type transporter Mla subunit MlaD
MALVLFVLGFGLFVIYGLIALDTASRLLEALSILSFLLTVFGFVWSYGKDLRWIAVEEDDIEHVFATFKTHPSTEEEHRKLLLSVTEDRKGGVDGSNRVETLLDDRAVSVLEPEGPGRSAITESEFRTLAVARSASIGSCARYVSSLLLLLTVLGTFIGIKAALPQLIEALNTASGIGADATTTLRLMHDALGSVGGAFGSNLGALLGSISLGLASFGLSSGRQNTLARLEQVSSVYVYPLRASRMHETSLADTVKTLAKASANFGGVGEQLGDFGNAIQNLAATVQDSLDGTRRAIQELLKQQSAQVAQESRQVVDKVERQITETAISVQQATGLYSTIAGTLADQSDALVRAMSTVDQAAAELRKSREQFAIYVDSATQTLDQRLGRLEQGVTRHSKIARRTYREFARIESGVAGLSTTALALATTIRDAEASQREALRELDVKTADAIAARLGMVTSPITESSQAIMESSRAMIESAQLSTDASRSLPRAIREATEAGIEAGLRRTKAEQSNDGASAEKVTAAFERLAETMNTLEYQLSRPLWHRLLRGRARRGGRGD